MDPDRLRAVLDAIPAGRWMSYADRPPASPAIAIWAMVCGALLGTLGYVDWHIFAQIGALLFCFFGVSLMAPYLYGWTNTPPKGPRGAPRQNGHGAPKGAA